MKKDNRELYIECVNRFGGDFVKHKLHQFLLRMLRNNASGAKPAKSESIKMIVEYLNQVTGKSYRMTMQTKSLIQARLNDGFVYDDFKKVIDIKSHFWLDDIKMNQYLRPQTLFSPKFESYLQEWYTCDSKRKRKSDNCCKSNATGVIINKDEKEKQELWQKNAQCVLDKATETDYKEFYHTLRGYLQRTAYKQGIKNNIIKVMYIDFLRKKYPELWKVLNENKQDRKTFVFKKTNEKN